MFNNDPYHTTHCCATRRFRKNSLQGIRDEAGVWRTRQEEIGEVMVNYFKSLFTALEGIVSTGALDCVPPLIDEEMNGDLCCEFEASEVAIALKQMAPLKAPGPDGMPPLFYQNFWSTVNQDVTSSILSWLNSGTIPTNLNHTFITLVPKLHSPEFPHQFRPISLCNVLYKIYSKVLANLLKKILPSIITEHQSTFTKGRLISDNILVAFETFHSLQNFRGGNYGYMALKLDMSKAYDRVEWSYLEGIMRKMGFRERWINLVMGCVKIVSYSVLVNGDPCGIIFPTRGIRQGDPLSPFLFLLCTEGLNGLIKKADLQGEIHGYSLCRRGPKLTHLLFADDSLIFCRATMEECGKVLNILKEYEEASGPKMNRSKTSLFFSKSVPEEEKYGIKVAIGEGGVNQGLPSLVGKGKKESFNYIKEKAWRKLQGWEAKLLSQAGREVLLKAVIQAIPTYTMGCFKLPVGLCNEIESLIKKFWWGQKGDRRKIHWIKWEEMTKSKTIGGMDFRDLAMFNDSPLAK